MSWTYSGDPLNSRLDRIRALIGDTNSQEPLIDDEILLWLMEQNPNDYKVASEACSVIATRFSREADLEVGDLALRFSQIAQAYRQAALEFAAKASSFLEVGTPILTASNKTPLFKIRQFDREAQ